MDFRLGLLKYARNCPHAFKLNQSYRRIHITASLSINPKNVEEVKIPVPWGHIAGKWWGDRDRQPILALHGWQDNASTFDPLLELLPESVSVLAVDDLGHGLSSHIPPGLLYHSSNSIIMCRRIQRHYNWTEPMTILGHSKGAVMGLLFTALYPECVDNLIMIDVVKPVSAGKKFMKKMGENVDSTVANMTRSAGENKKYSLEEIEKRWIAGTKGSLTSDAVKVLLRRAVQPDGDSGKYSFTRDPRLKIWSLYYFDEEQQLRLASNINCNLLVIRFSDGKFLDASLKNAPNYIETIEKAAKSFKMVTVEGTHHAHLNEPQKVAPIVIEFLEKYFL